ncbi:MAG: ShlB/FhaC/HecB family hemolysin secretion/activation protein [Betaproteobacteria bacterium]|nr:ShlB/FhaC/HecB family hemolysin secretion/activation protein [Betaproteobacteria bacterium]MDE2622984.1 ShlB/FhaC/HecB family hemolysin secretion/activation protein [Betaproteobacteria bacterium]
MPKAPGERPPLRGDSSLRVRVKRIVVTGNSAFTAQELLPLVDDAVGKTLTFDELQALAARITQYYRTRGYLLAHAYIPAQDVTEGTLEIAVLEGRYGKVRLDNRSGLSDTALNWALAPLESGQVVQSESLERQLLLMSDLPGAAVTSTLKPGDSTGTSDLDVRVTSASALSGSVGFDNWGNRYTGSSRGFVAADWANPLGLGDRISLYGMGAERDGTEYERVAYDLPTNGAGTRVGAAVAHLLYSLGLDFAALQAHGSADIMSLYLNHPVVRSYTTNANFQLNYDHRTLHDYVDSSTSHDSKHLDVFSAGFDGNRLSAQGAGNWRIAIAGGHVGLDDLTASLDQAGYRTAGNYYKTTGSGSDLLPLTGRWSLYGALSGQLASKNLDMSEKFPMGGPSGVRAYPVGEAMSDDAWIATFELRYSMTEQLQLDAFADGGGSRLNHTPLPTDARNQRSLSGVGLGATWVSHSRFSLLTYLAWRTGEAPTSAPDRHPTAWIQAAQGF